MCEAAMSEEKENVNGVWVCQFEMWVWWVSKNDLLARFGCCGGTVVEAEEREEIEEEEEDKGKKKIKEKIWVSFNAVCWILDTARYLNFREGN